MKMPIIEAYLDDLIKNSTLDVPAWNIEAARKGGKSGWNYIDGCMILAMIETWKITGEKNILILQRHILIIVCRTMVRLRAIIRKITILTM